MSRVNIEASEITLIDFTTISFSIDVVNDGDFAESNKSNDLQIRVEEVKASEEALKEDLRMFSLVVSVSSNPSDNTAFYTCEARIGGSFLVDPESNLKDDEVRDILSVKGVEEIYDVIRVKIAEATSSGTFGMYILPSIHVVANKD